MKGTFPLTRKYWLRKQIHGVIDLCQQQFNNVTYFLQANLSGLSATIRKKVFTFSNCLYTHSKKSNGRLSLAKVF